MSTRFKPAEGKKDYGESPTNKARHEIYLAEILSR